MLHFRAIRPYNRAVSILIFAALFITMMPFIIGATYGGKSDFIVIENISKLVIYNKFGQTLSPTELKNFPSFVPFKVLSKKAVLSDGFSSAISVEYNSKQYSILTESNGNIVNNQQCGYLKNVYAEVFENESFVAIRTDIKVYNHKGVEYFLNKGEKYQLRYKTEEESCFYNEKTNSYQLIKNTVLQNDKICKSSVQKKESKVFDKQTIVRGLTDIILTQNKEIKAQFTLFNKVNHTSLIAPHLQLESNDNRIIVAISSESVPGAFDAYFHELIKIVNDYLIGTKYSCSLSKEGLEIKL